MSYRLDGTSWIYSLYLALIVWVPVPLGSNRPWSWAVLEVWVLLLTLAWLAGYIRGTFTCGTVFPRAWPVLLCAALWVCYVWLQLVPLPAGLLQQLSPEAARWHGAAALPAKLAWAPLTLDRYGTLESACKSTAYVAFFALGLVLLRDRDRVRFATYAVIVSGIGQALYGTLASYQAGGASAAGTFVNRNHFAGYLEMCLSVGIGMLIASLSGEKYRSWGEFFRGVFQWVITPKMGLRLLLVTMVIALVLSRSRMGNSAFFVSLLVAGLIGLALSRRATRSTVVLIASLIVIDIFIIGAYVGTQRVVESIGQTTMQGEDRDEVAGYALAMWKDYPVFGSGLGSFSSVFPRYSGQGTFYAYTHAHNDYLEFAAETGLIGMALLGAIVLMSFAVSLRAQQVRNDPVMRGISFAAMMGITSLMIHSSVDFNLQIPANAVTFMLLLTFAWASLYCEDPRG